MKNQSKLESLDQNLFKPLSKSTLSKIVGGNSLSYTPYKSEGWGGCDCVDYEVDEANQFAPVRH